jgi:hypothetical protein
MNISIPIMRDGFPRMAGRLLLPASQHNAVQWRPASKPSPISATLVGVPTGGRIHPLLAMESEPAREAEANGCRRESPCREWIEPPDDDRSIHLSERLNRDSRAPRSVTNAGGVDGDRKRRKPNGLGQITPLLARSPDGSLSLKIGSRLGSRHSHAAVMGPSASTAPLAGDGSCPFAGRGGFPLAGFDLTDQASPSLCRLSVSNGASSLPPRLALAPPPPRVASGPFSGGVA